MSGYKPRPSRIRARLGLTTKQVGGGYYKGNRTGSMGFFGPKKGTYFIDYRKVRTYVVPEGLEDFKLTPFVTKRMAPTKSEYIREELRERVPYTSPRMMDGKDFLRAWMMQNETEYDQLLFDGQSGQEQSVEEQAEAESLFPQERTAGESETSAKSQLQSRSRTQ